MIELCRARVTTSAKVAAPLKSVSVSSTVPVAFRSSTVPVGVPVAGLIGATVMLNVTVCPKTGVVVEGVTVVVDVAAAATVRCERRRGAGREIAVAHVIRGDRVGTEAVRVEVWNVATPFASVP